MRVKKLWAFALVGAMAVGSLAGCGSSKESKGDAKQTAAAGDASKSTDASGTKKVALKVWGPQEDQAAVTGYKEGWLKGMCEKFNEAHPEWDITFTYGVCAEDQAYKTIKNDVAAAADVYMAVNDQIPDLAAIGAIAQLGGKTQEAIKADNDESIVNSVTFKDALYGVPFTSNTWFMYYDKSKYSEDDVKSLDTMMKKDLGSGVYNLGMKLDNSWYTPSFFFAAGCNLFGESGTDVSKGVEFNNDEGVAAAKYLSELSKNKKFSLDKDNDTISKMKAGKCAAFFSGSWDYTQISEALGKNCGVTVLPKVTIGGKEGQLRSFSGSKAVFVNPNCKESQVAVALAAYLGGQEAQQAHYDCRKIIPTNKTILASDVLKKDIIAQTQQEVINTTSKVQPVLNEMSTFWVPVESFCKEVCQGNVNDANAKSKLDSMVQGIIKK